MNPWISFIIANLLLVLGRLRFSQEKVGHIYQVNGQNFTVFRQMKRQPFQGTPKPEAVFKVRFRLARMNPRLNKAFSFLTIPFFCGLPGFRSKSWLLDEANHEFMGIYEWATRRDAENYSKSYAMRFMTGRSIPGTISFVIKPNSDRRN